MEQLWKALLSGDSAAVETCLQSFVTDLLSYHDVPFTEIEPIIHVFTLGLLAVMEPGYQVRSNRESGSGRPDILIKPVATGQPGAVLEFKRIGGRSRRRTRARLSGSLRKSYLGVSIAMDVLEDSAGSNRFGSQPIFVKRQAFPEPQVPEPQVPEPHVSCP